MIEKDPPMLFISLMQPRELNVMLEATGAILAGGKSLRMGAKKAMLRVGRQLMVQRVADELKKVFPEVIISGDDQEVGGSLGLPVVPDLVSLGVPICGIHAALHAARHPVVLAVACDMPFVTGNMAELMVSLVDGYDVAVPKRGEYLQPLFAVYCRSCLPAIEKRLSAGESKTTCFYEDVKVNYVDLEKYTGLDWEAVFFNVNTPGDLRKARGLVRGEK